MMRFVLPVLLPHLARTQELLLLFAIAWAVLLASVGDFLGFSKEVGAFLAGVSLASTPFREAIAGRLVSLRDFMLLFFFIGLGAQLDLTTLGSQIVPALIFSVFVLIGNPSDRHGDYGIYGIQQTDRFSRRSYGRSNQ
jgi:Kef-type K+ transport system membrane component KefB